ncbi:MAG: hypothetical protein DRN96_04285 [Thermoproteota archaeon]|nr:MAG: hypothetical protein DRN99_08750 [Candidatus Korarchaeota archaeon]RLG51849.1 MAG: hypothetical protein DRN96_04285 [Candidatus Korarchaeota archaeon]
MRDEGFVLERREPEARKRLKVASRLKQLCEEASYRPSWHRWLKLSQESVKSKRWHALLST